MLIGTHSPEDAKYLQDRARHYSDQAALVRTEIIQMNRATQAELSKPR